MRLNKWLTVNGVSRADFASRASTTVAAVSHWCNGRRIPTIPHLEAIVAITGGAVTTADFKRNHAAFKRRQAALVEEQSV